MSGGIADTLAAHQRRAIDFRTLGCTGCDWVGPEGVPWREAHAAHQAEVLSSAGYGPLSALLDDLRGLAHDWTNPRWTHPPSGDAAAEVEGCASDLLAVVDKHAARYAPSDPTPKDQR